ncbi:MAG TPA: AMP-binding protein, partial [Verrucomicrobiae bacterium]|nr:AMP-binding protein [Verrucomicrobiae bacterium]
IEQLAEKIGIYRKAWRQSGKSGRGQVTLMLHTFVASDMDSAWKKVRKPLWDYLKNYRDLSANVSSRGNKAGGDLETLLNEAVNRYFGMTGLFGSPEHCCKTVQKMRELGVDEIACLIDFGVDIESVLHSLRYLQTVLERTNRSVFSGARSYSIAEQIHRHSVTHFQCTPSLVSMLAEDEETIGALRRLKKIMLGGEAFPPQLAERLKGKAQILNMYGPTETTIWSTMHRVDAVAESIPIGRPIANTQIYIVDREFQPVPVNVPGELLIGGAGVARGYLNRPELTNQRFIADPFSGQAGARLYRTGDLARYLPNGDVEYLGRTDHQVKLRGFRIELGEIEAALRLHPAIRDAAVIVREVSANDKRLFGYATLKAQQRPAIADLKKFLKEKLPDYMVPSAIMFLDELPLTPNGKIDRKALPNPEIRRADGDSAFAPAQSELEKSLARIWEQVLQIERVGLNDNFFEIGGHSLLAAQVQARMSDILKVELPIIKLFQYPTISALAKYLNEDQKEVVSFQKVQDRARRQREAFAWRKQSTAGSSV